MSQINILLAEDDPNLGMVLKAYLDAKKYPTTLCSNGEEALQAFRNNNFDFCIFDVMMPVMDGFTLAKEIRKTNTVIPIIFLTAKTQPDDVLHGFESGADDYITKPFSMDELLMRVQAVYRRYMTSQGRPSFFEIGNYSFDAPHHELILDGEARKLTSKESDLLLLLCENLNNTVERGMALKRIWKEDNYFNARSMDVYVTKLRKYLEGDPNIQLLNVHGVGFKLVVK